MKTKVVADLLLFSGLRKSSCRISEVWRIRSECAGALYSQSLGSSQSRSYGFSPRRSTRGDPKDDRSEDQFLRSLNFGSRNAGDDRKEMDGRGRSEKLFPGDDADENSRSSGKVPLSSQKEEREAASSRLGGEFFSGSFGASRQNSSLFPPGGPQGKDEAGGWSGDLADGKKHRLSGDRPESFLLQKLKLGMKKDEDKAQAEAPIQIPNGDPPLSESAAPDADDIFRKMKETGLIPNAVAMLDGLCKDGLIQEAMKLFGVMRETGTIPEIVVYTAVVEGFSKAERFDDAKRVFRKMQNHGISPNAFSYKVLIEGLLRGKRLEDSVDFCLEMLDAGHSLTVATFTDVIDEACKVKGVEEAGGVVRRLRERGLAVDDRAVREHLDKKGPSTPQIWEAIFGKKPSQRPL